MMLAQLARKGREWLNAAAEHAEIVSIVLWLALSLVSIADLRDDLQRIGPALATDWVQVSRFITQPIFIALLVYLMLHFAARQEKTAEAAQDVSEEVERRTHDLEILHDISVAVTSTLDLDQILRIVYDKVGPVLNANTFFIALYQEATHELHFEFLVDKGVISPKVSQTIDPATSLSGWIIEHKEPLLIGDLTRPGASPVPAGVIGSPSRSWLGIPLILQDRVIGILSVQSYEPDKFDAGELRLLSAAANQISMAIENARLFAQTRARAEEMVVANEITRAINSTLDLEEVLKLFFDRMASLFNIEAGSLLLLDPLTNELVFESVHGGAGDKLLHKRMRSYEGIVGWVTQHNVPLLVPDVHKDSRWFNWFDENMQFTTRSILAAPIRVEDRVIGAIEIMNRRDGKPFSEADLKLLGLFAASAGIAIENARLHRQTEKRLTEVTALNLIANQLATGPDAGQILSPIVNRLRAIFNTQTCAIHLLDAEKRALRLEAISTPIPEHTASTIPIGQGIVGQVAAEGALMYVESSEGMFPGAEIHPGIQSILTVPLSSRDRVLGTLSLWSTAPHAFSEDDKRLLTTVAAQIATALENARLYEDLQQRAENLKQAYDDLKELDRLKTEFVHNVSHELRTPLTFIKGYVELVRTNTLGDLAPQVREGIDIIADKTNVLVRLVDDVLTLQDAETDTLKLGTVHLGKLALEAVRQASPAANEARVQLHADVAPDLPACPGDAERLNRVFQTLLDNAIKFSPDGGEVCVRVCEADEQLQVEVEDHGIGIPAEQLEKIFTRFYQVDGSTTRRFGGTGLGLAIVKQIVEAHHGRVWVTSQPGKGSTFYFRLPKHI